MQNFRAIRTISIILGFVLAFFGCTTGGGSINDFNKDKNDTISDLTIIVKG